jgi:hypothetical protein
MQVNRERKCGIPGEESAALLVRNARVRTRWIEKRTIQRVRARASMTRPPTKRRRTGPIPPVLQLIAER